MSCALLIVIIAVLVARFAGIIALICRPSRVIASAVVVCVGVGSAHGQSSRPTAEDFWTSLEETSGRSLAAHWCGPPYKFCALSLNPLFGRPIFINLTDDGLGRLHSVKIDVGPLSQFEVTPLIASSLHVLDPRLTQLQIFDIIKRIAAGNDLVRS